MPELSRFLGIIIYMHFNEHKAAIAIKTLGLLEGRLPARVMSLVVEWAQDHQDDLLANWNSISETGEYRKITPLV